jgi:hypothetical protein
MIVDVVRGIRNGRRLLTVACLLLIVSVAPASSGCSDSLGGFTQPACSKVGGQCNLKSDCCTGLLCVGGTCMNNPE